MLAVANIATIVAMKQISWQTCAQTLLNLVFPRGCAGCGFCDEVLCPQCVARFHAWRVATLPATLIGYRYACADYSHEVRRAILAWKDHDDVACDYPFAVALATLVKTVLVTWLRINNIQHVAIVPIASSRSSQHNRGRRHLEPLAKFVASALQSEGLQARYVDALVMNPHVNHKSVQHAGARYRAHRALHAFTLRERSLIPGSFVILMDDIVTTGATMNSCVRVLNDAHMHVVAGFSLACVTSEDVKGWQTSSTS